MEFFNRKIIKLPLILFMSVCGLVTSCNEKTNNTGFDNRVFDISLAKDNSLLATTNKINNHYTLSISGSGEMRNFKKGDLAPWQAISKSIKEVTINNGLTSIGDNAFDKLTLDYYIIPETVTKLGNNSFNTNAKIYSYSTNEIQYDNSNSYLIYYFSNTQKDSETIHYWHMVNDMPISYELNKVLFIGNSFTFYSDIPILTSNVSSDLGFNVEIESVTNGSWNLTKFANKDDEYGKVVYEKLTTHSDYDYVILQEQSTRSYSNNKEFKAGAKSLYNLVKSTQTNCEVRLYATWGYQKAADDLNTDIPGMEKTIRDKYNELASELNVKVHPVGEAFTSIYENHKDINLYFTDNMHPSIIGSYLSSLIHAGCLFNVDITKTNFIPSGVNENIATILKDTAKSILVNKGVIL